MTLLSFLIALSVCIAFAIHYFIRIMANSGVLFQISDVEERSKKMFSYGVLGILNSRFATGYGNLMAWVTLLTFGLYYLSAILRPEPLRRKWGTFTGLAFTGTMTFWWIGSVTTIFVLFTS